MRLRGALRAGAAVTAGLVLAAPLLALLSAALRAPDTPMPRSFEWWPADPGFAAFEAAWSLVPFGAALLNSLLVTVAGVALSLLTASWAGFALTQIAARPRRWLLMLLVVAASVPYTVLWLPRFLMFESLGAVGTVWPLIAPGLMGGSPLFVLLLYAAARRIPGEWIDAARVEGLGWLGVWWQVVLPLLRRSHAAVAVLAAALFWGNFLDPLLYLHGDRDTTAPVLLHALELLGPTQWPVLMAGALLLAAPACLFAWLASRWMPSAEKGAWSEH